MAQDSDTSNLLGKIGQYEETLAQDPRSKVFVPLAETYRQMGLLDDALAAARRGLLVHPEYPLGHVALGRIQAQRREMEDAAQSFERALDLDGDNLQGLKGLARVYLLRKRAGEALPLVKRLVQLAPGDPEVQKLAATVKGSSGSQAAPSPEGGGGKEAPIKTATLAEIYIKQGLLREAIKVYREILEAHPENEEIRRKALALKKRLEEEGGAAAAPSPPKPASPVPPPAPQPQAPAATKSAPVAAPPKGPSSPDSGEGAIRNLEAWLEIIRKRREHVQ